MERKGNSNANIYDFPTLNLRDTSEDVNRYRNKETDSMY